MSEQIQQFTTEDLFLKYKVLEGFRRRGLPMTEKYVERIEHECKIIAAMNYATYFLIVADLCRFMIERDILFVVRGSGCGSCYVWGLGISEVWLDPIQYGLPFERFLNPSRVTMPDLDIDIDDTRRNEVVEYTIQKYGRDRVAKIITFGTLAAKNAIKDVGRSLNIPDYDKIAAEICAFIPAGKGEDGKNIRLADELKRNEGLREYERKYREWFGYAMRVEGKIRNASIHAAGTIIAPDSLTKYLPTIFWGNPEDRTPEENFPCTQWDMYDCEARGLLKMDYLGLKTLRVIAQTRKCILLIQKALGQPDDFDLRKIDRRDQETWTMLAEGRTSCVFQIERSFCQNYAKRMSLGTNRDPWQLAVLISIIRPGMMDTGATEEYLLRASGKKPAPPMHPLLEKTLASNYHLFVFQEDCMWAAMDMADFTMAEADDLRRAISKKKPKDMARIKPKFISGAIAKGATAEAAEMVWMQMETFGRYGFNNAHAAAYGMVIGWWTAWMKRQWTLPFMMNMINSESGRGDKDDGYNYKVAEYVEESRALGIAVLPPCVKRSAGVCSLLWKEKQIRFGISLIKKVSVGAVAWIMAGAKKANSFKDFVLAGFEIRTGPDGTDTPYSKISKTDHEGLLQAGALDCFEAANRSKMLAMLPTVMELAKKFHEQTGKEKAGRKTRLKAVDVKAELDAYHLDEGMYPELSLEQRLEMEQEVTGCFLSESPFLPYRQVIHDSCNCTVGDIRQGLVGGENMVFVGVLNKISPTVVKNGKNKGAEMGFLGFTGIDGAQIEAVAFNKTWTMINDPNFKPGRLEKGKVFIASARRDKDRPDSYILNDCTRLSNCGFDAR